MTTKPNRIGYNQRLQLLKKTMDKTEEIEQSRDELTAELGASNVTILQEGAMLEEEKDVVADIFGDDDESVESALDREEVVLEADIHPVAAPPEITLADIIETSEETIHDNLSAYSEGENTAPTPSALRELLMPMKLRMDDLIKDEEIEAMNAEIKSADQQKSESYMLSYILKADLVIAQQAVMITRMTEIINRLERKVTDLQSKTSQGLAILESKLTSRLHSIESVLVQPDGLMSRSLENMVSSKFHDLQSMSYDMSKIQADMAIVVNAIKGFTSRISIP